MQEIGIRNVFGITPKKKKNYFVFWATYISKKFVLHLPCKHFVFPHLKSEPRAAMRLKVTSRSPSKGPGSGRKPNPPSTRSRVEAAGLVLAPPLEVQPARKTKATLDERCAIVYLVAGAVPRPCRQERREGGSAPAIRPAAVLKLPAHRHLKLTTKRISSWRSIVHSGGILHASNY